MPDLQHFSLWILRRPYTLVVPSSAPPIMSVKKLTLMLRRLQSASVVGGAVVAPAAASSNEIPFLRRTVSCRTISMKSYVLKVQNRVFRGGDICLPCDALEGPVMVRRSLLRRFPVPDIRPLGMATTLLSWFISLQKAGKTVISCLDVQLRLTKPLELLEETKDVSPDFGKSMHVSQLRLPGGWVIQLPCSVVRPAGSIRALVKNSAVPPCLIEEVGAALQGFLSYTHDKKLTPQLMGGSVLAAVKMSALLPWDLDLDVRIRHEQWHQYRDIGTALPGLFTISNIQKPMLRNSKNISTINLGVSAMTIELWGSDPSFFPEVPFSLPDTVAGMDFSHGSAGRRLWFPVPRNPGLYVRDYYGPGYLQHAPHWRHLGAKSNHQAYDKSTVRRWLPCPPGTPACLQQFPIDGNTGVRLENARDDNW